MRSLSIALLLAGCTGTPAQDQLVISGLQQGLMRADAKGEWHVYERGAVFPYRENGQCTVNGTKTSCMWLGFEFDFRSPTETTVLSCHARLHSPADIVTPKKEHAKEAQEFQFDLTLSGKAGHMSNPGYMVRESNESPEQHTEVECMHSGKVVLRYEFQITGV